MPRLTSQGKVVKRLKAAFAILLALFAFSAAAQGFVDVTAGTRQCDYTVRATTDVVAAPYLPVLSGRPVFLSLRGGGVAPDGGRTALRYLQVLVESSPAGVRIQVKADSGAVVPFPFLGNCIEVPVTFTATGNIPVHYNIDVYFQDGRGGTTNLLRGQESFLGNVNVTGSGLTYAVPSLSDYALGLLVLLFAGLASSRLKNLSRAAGVAIVFFAVLGMAEHPAWAQSKPGDAAVRGFRKHPLPSLDMPANQRLPWQASVEGKLLRPCQPTSRHALKQPFIAQSLCVRLVDSVSHGVRQERGRAGVGERFAAGD
jgi:hypothetical protein